MPGVRGGVKPADLLATIRAEIEARRDELHAAVEEYEQLLSAADALEREARSTPAPVAPKAPLVRRMRITSKASVVRKAAPLPKAKTVVRTVTKTPSKPKQAPTKAPPAPEPAPAKAIRTEKKAPATRASREESQQAIVAALEHGSHTVAELAIVTAMTGPAIREVIRALQKARKVTKTKRVDGKAAYALSS